MFSCNLGILRNIKTNYELDLVFSVDMHFLAKINFSRRRCSVMNIHFWLPWTYLILFVSGIFKRSIHNEPCNLRFLLSLFQSKLQMFENRGFSTYFWISLHNRILVLIVDLSLLSFVCWISCFYTNFFGSQFLQRTKRPLKYILDLYGQVTIVIRHWEVLGQIRSEHEKSVLFLHY